MKRITQNNLKMIETICYECETEISEYISLSYCITLCLKCSLKYSNYHLPSSSSSLSNNNNNNNNGDFFQIILISNLKSNEINKYSYGGNKRFKEYIICLKLLKGYHFDSYFDTFISPPVLYYRDVLEAESKKNNQITYNENYYHQLSLYYKKDIYEVPKIAPLWAPDTSTEECMLCNVKFSFFKRRHHCRSCGLCICSQCISSSFSNSKIFLLKCCQRSDLQCKLCCKTNLIISYNMKDFVFTQVSPQIKTK